MRDHANMKPADLVMPASAISLAGGGSSRMGTPKLLLPFDGAPLITHIVRKLKTLFADVVVVVSRDQELPQLGLRSSAMK